MSDFYSRQHRAFQDEFGTRPLADRVESVTVHDFISDKERTFIESRDMLFLSTIDERGMPSVSYKGGEPGFVRVDDEKTLVFPSYNGNGMFLSTGNIRTNGKIGLLFIDFEKPNRIRVHGSAQVEPAADDLYGSELIVRVTVDEMFVNCPRYIHRYRREGSSPYVPRKGAEVPLAAWKRIDALQDVLSDAERAQAKEAGLMTARDYERLIESEG